MCAVEELTSECLGHAGLVYEHVLGEDKFTFVEVSRSPEALNAVNGLVWAGLVYMDALGRGQVHACVEVRLG